VKRLGADSNRDILIEDNKEAILNIFVTNACPKKCAEFLDSARLRKMVLETAQLLSSAIQLCGYTGSDVYKITHKNHPSNVWCRTSQGNYKWLLAHFKALCEEYTLRAGKTHASSKLLPVLEANTHLLPEGNQTPFSNNARNLTKGVDFTHESDVHIAYQLYLGSRWETDKREPTWS
jgi:hypothetical protein